MKVSQAIGLAVFCLVGVIGLGWLAQGNQFFLYKVFAPKYEQVRRETFEESKAFNQGMVQELQNMQFEYLQAAPEHQSALASIILHRAADYDVTRLPADLRDFITKLRNDRSLAR